MQTGITHQKLTTNDILLFLIRNSKYYLPSFTSAKEKYQEMKKIYKSKSNWFYDVDWYISPMHTEVKVLNEFFQTQEFDWNLLKPLYDQKLIWVHDGDGKITERCFSHLSKEFRQNCRKSTGIVRDYDANIDYFRFYIGDCNPNDLIDFDKLTKIK